MDNYIYVDGARVNKIVHTMNYEQVAKILGQLDPLEKTDGYLLLVEGRFDSGMGDSRKFEARIYDEETEFECCPAALNILKFRPIGNDTLLFVTERKT